MSLYSDWKCGALTDEEYWSMAGYEYARGDDLEPIEYGDAEEEDSYGDDL